MEWAFRSVGSAARAHGPAPASRAAFGAGSIAVISIVAYVTILLLLADQIAAISTAGLVALSALVVRNGGRKVHVAHLPFVDRLLRAVPVLLAAGATFVLGGATSPLRAALLSVGAVVLGVLLGLLARGLPGGDGPTVRVAVVGPPPRAQGLADELGLGRATDFDLVGSIDRVATGGNSLTEVVEREDIDLVLVDRAGPESEAFEEIQRTWIDFDVPVEMLSNFYEIHLGRAPLAAIDAIWLRDVLQPTSRYTAAVRRTVDLAVSGSLLLLCSPVLLTLVLLVRRDGSPAFYRQERVGRGGRSFEILKLRSMRPDTGSDARWSAADDDRVTPIGRFMRRTHLDEIPQLINILRGDMALVGPRPEQAVIVEQLQEDIPFYNWRHRVRPGLTGWAQVIAGYCGTDRGSAIKTCYDLYYLKYRSLGLDILILFETARTLLADRQWQIPDYDDTFIPDRVIGGGDHAPPTVEPERELVISGTGGGSSHEATAQLVGGH